MTKQYSTNLDPIRFLTSLVDYSHLPQVGFMMDQFDLQRMRDLLACMGNPQTKYPIIHIAGTKGKGSTAAIMAAVLQAAGYRVGLFTSPWLFDFREQIQINRVPISEAELSQQVEILKIYLERIGGITTFEATTVIAFQFFKEQAIDIAIIEAGFGGKTDATNVVEPLISVITSISYDHTAVLGKTIREIAAHKSGIIKAGHPVVIARQPYPEAELILLDAAQSARANAILTDVVCTVKGISHNLDMQRICCEFVPDNGADWNGEFDMALLGGYQVENTATALTALRQLPTSIFDINREAVANGLNDIFWPCRFEVIQREPMIILDGAHNVESTTRLVSALDEIVKGKNIVLVFGVLVDKDIAGMLAVLLAVVKRVIYVPAPHPRGAETTKLVELGQKFTTPQEVADSIERAILRSTVLAEKEDVIVVTGSLSTAAAARHFILNE